MTGSEDRDPVSVRSRVESIRDDEVTRALSRLEASGDLTPEDRRAVERLADRIVERLLAPAVECAVTGDERRDEVVETAVRLFEK